jgi:HK97 gp10 family phage protein
MDSSVNITGFAELQAQLDKLPANIEKKLLRGALRAGQKTVLEQARQTVHSVSGDLAASLRISTGSRRGRVSATVKAGDKKAFYAKFVEFGTAAHIITAKAGQSLSFGGGQYASISHPGAMKKPFMRPALDQAAMPESAAFKAVGAYLQARITKELGSLPDEADVQDARA